MNGPRRAIPAVLTVLLTAYLLLPAPARADPTFVNEGGGFGRATWDFATPSDYTATNATLAAGNASLTRSSFSKPYDGSNFAAENESSPNVTVGPDVRLAGDPNNRIANGGFNTPANWTYTPSGNVSAAWDPVGRRARMNHSSNDANPFQFDSMDDVATTGWPGGPGSCDIGASITLNQEVVPGTVREGLGSLLADLDFGGFPTRVCSAGRNNAGTWDWSAYTHLAVWIEGTAAVGLEAYVHLENGFGGNPWDSNRTTLSSGWTRIFFDLAPFTIGGGDSAAIDLLQMRFTGVATTATVYVDDLVLFAAFDETASVASQSFTKPATIGNPGGVLLTFNLTAGVRTNLFAELRVDVGPFNWSFLNPTNISWTFTLDPSAALTANGTFTLRFALRLARLADGLAQYELSIDNVNLSAPDYVDGSYVAVPLDAGSAAIWTDATITKSEVPPITQVFVDTRTGNTTDTSDGTWTGWAFVSGTAIPSPPNRYLQWRLRLTTTNGSWTPIVTRVEIAYEKHAAGGVVRTNASFLPPEPLVAWRTFLASDARPNGTNVSYEVSDDSFTWVPVVDNQNVTAILGNRTAWVRAFLTAAANTSRTPAVAWFALRYEFFDIVDRIDVDPSSVNLRANESQVFTATAYDQWGHVLTTFGCDWETSDLAGNVGPDGGLVGTYQAGVVTVGAPHRVYCFNSDQSERGIAFVNVTAPGPLVAIEVCPDPRGACLPPAIPVARTQPLLAEGFDADGNSVPLSGTEWATTIGQLTPPMDAERATLRAPTTNGTGRVTACVGALCGGLDVTVTRIGMPRINGTVQDVVRPEDSLPYVWDLTRFAGNQPDPTNDTLDNLKWYLTGVDDTLYSVFGQDEFNRPDLVVTPVANASGDDDVVLWLEDRDGVRASQALVVRITSVNDSPTVDAIPRQAGIAGRPWTLDLAPYVADVDDPIANLTAATDSPSVTAEGLTLTFAFDAAWTGTVRITVTDGSGAGSGPVSVRVDPVAGATPEAWPWIAALLAVAAVAGVVGVALVLRRRRKADEAGVHPEGEG
ncbi:MAG TPA: hypothetical protein VJ400_09365 [Thermoplasmata archaeon]|nr:hypothetical protein [Thermoplasmata archaeon]